MEGKKIKTVLAVGALLLIPVSFYVGQRCSAADVSAPMLIDKDFETAVRKFVSKRFYNRISATAEQRQQLDAIWTSALDATRPDREQVREGMLDMANMLASDDVPDEKIVEKAHELRAIHEKVQDQRLDSMLKARKVLTKEQREKMSARLTEFITGGGRPGRMLVQ